MIKMSKDLETKVNVWNGNILEKDPYKEPKMTRVNSSNYRHIEVVDGIYDAFEKKAVDHSKIESKKYGAN